MSKNRVYNAREVKTILRNNGYKIDRYSGSHEIYVNDNGNHITIPASKVNRMMFQRLIKENNLNVNI